VARKTSHSLMNTTPRDFADKAKDTWSELSSTLESAVGRTQSAAHDAQGSLRDTRKNAKSSVRKARKNADKRVTDARRSVKSVRDESGRRTNAARDALAGRAPRRRWTMLVGIIGVGFGAVVGAAAARLARRSDAFDQLEAKLSSGMKLSDTELSDTELSDTKTAADGAPPTGSVMADVPPLIGTGLPAPTPIASAITTPQAVSPTGEATVAATGSTKTANAKTANAKVANDETATDQTQPVPSARNLNGSAS
jgi:gas vesicle protein